MLWVMKKSVLHRFGRVLRKLGVLGPAPRAHNPDIQELISLIPNECGGESHAGEIIFDIGMHVGQDTAFYLAKGFRVLAIEANPLLVQDAQKAFEKQIDAGRLTILNVGVGDKEGVFPFYINNYSEWSSFDREIGSREGCKEVVDVSMLPFERILAQYGAPYFMKIDIEGYDFRSGPTKLNSAISGNFGHAAGSVMTWRKGVFDGEEEIRAADTPHAQRNIQGARGPGRLARGSHTGRSSGGV